MTTLLQASFNFLLRFIPQTEYKYDIESQLTAMEQSFDDSEYEPMTEREYRICDLGYIVIQMDNDNIRYLASLV
jgi:hypothetical protein